MLIERKGGQAEQGESCIGPEVIRHPHPGLYIVFEGGEGSGKTTHSQLLAEFLSQAGYEVLLTREPGGTVLGQHLRSALLLPENEEMIPTYHTEALIFAADRSQHGDQKLRPALERGWIVVSDRSFLSSMAYQGQARGLGMREVWEMNIHAVRELAPDLVLFMDVLPSVGLLRREADGDVNRLDGEKLAFHQAARVGYMDLIRRDQARWHIVPDSPIEWQRNIIVHRVLADIVAKGIKPLSMESDSSRALRMTSSVVQLPHSG